MAYYHNLLSLSVIRVTIGTMPEAVLTATELSRNQTLSFVISTGRTGLDPSSHSSSSHNFHGSKTKADAENANINFTNSYTESQ